MLPIRRDSNHSPKSVLPPKEALASASLNGTPPPVGADHALKNLDDITDASANH